MLEMPEKYSPQCPFMLTFCPNRLFTMAKDGIY
jgi:hypothetical protein